MNSLMKLMNNQNQNKTPKLKKVKNKKRFTIKRLNCSPFVKGKTTDKNTCYTDKILIQIRNAFNSQIENSSNKIITNNPSDILIELRNKLSKYCRKENCWLNLLTVEQHKVIDNMVFAPEKPTEWKDNPTEWLSNYDIFKVLRQYERSNPEFKFIGPTPIDFDTMNNENRCVWDELCNFSLKNYIKDNKKKIGIVFNLDKHNESGSHWVSMFIDIDEEFIFYFDSASNKTPSEINTFVNRILLQSEELNNGIKYHYYENYPNNHQKSNTECGMYSLFFIITMLSDMSTRKKIQLFKQKKIPDKRVKQLRDVYFNEK